LERDIADAKKKMEEVKKDLLTILKCTICAVELTFLSCLLTIYMIQQPENSVSQNETTQSASPPAPPLPSEGPTLQNKGGLEKSNAPAASAPQQGQDSEK
jgi:hypothetical protein